MTISVEDRFQTILSAIENTNSIYDEIEIVSEYGDHGYDLEEGKKAILLSNWNVFDKFPNIMEFLEENFELEWSDEWVVDYTNDRCFRSSPDSYGWQPQFVILDGEVMGVDELNEMDEDDFIEFLEKEDYLNNPKNAINLYGFEPKGEGIDEDDYLMFERGCDPSKMLEEALEKYPEKNFYFVVDSVAQFGLNFSLYML
jgi:hypothetical protein